MKERKEIKLSLGWHILERYHFTLIQWNQFSGIKGDTSDKDNYCCFFVEWEILRILSFTFSFFLPSFFYLFDLHMGQSVQEWTKYNLRKTAFKKFEVMSFQIISITTISLQITTISLHILPYHFKFFKSRPYHFKFFKSCLPRISLGPSLNTLSHL